MSGTTTGIVVFCVVIVLSLAVWLVMVARAAADPVRSTQREPLRGLAQGGQHVGGGRSIAPTVTPPVPEGGGNPPSVGDEGDARSGSPRDRRPGTPAVRWTCDQAGRSAVTVLLSVPCS